MYAHVLCDLHNIHLMTYSDGYIIDMPVVKYDDVISFLYRVT